ncbi:MAG: hypothetical protein ABIR46_01365 [Candidatus Saccharimonadales bacterium]
MRKFLGSLLVCFLIATALNLADGPASADPEIGQGISGFKMKITEFDDTGDFSINRVCGKKEVKYFMFDAAFKPGVKGRFAQIDRSLVRLKLSDGRVAKTQGLAVDSTRRLLAFTLSTPLSGPRVTIDPTGHNYLMLTVKGGAGPQDIVLTPLDSLCVGQAQPTS